MEGWGGRRFEDADLRDNPGVSEAGLDAKLQQMVAGFPKIIRNALDEAEKKEKAKEKGAETGK